MATWVTAYCVKCRKKVGLIKPKIVTLKKGRSKVKMEAWKGTCPTCKSDVFRIIGKAKV